MSISWTLLMYTCNHSVFLDKDQIDIQNVAEQGSFKWTQLLFIWYHFNRALQKDDFCLNKYTILKSD